MLRSVLIVAFALAACGHGATSPSAAEAVSARYLRDPRGPRVEVLTSCKAAERAGAACPGAGVAIVQVDY